MERIPAPVRFGGLLPLDVNQPRSIETPFAEADWLRISSPLGTTLPGYVLDAWVNLKSSPVGAAVAGLARQAPIARETGTYSALSHFRTNSAGICPDGYSFAAFCER